MALIKCPECGGQVSDKAPACIHCGYPLQEIVSKSTCIINYAEQDVTDIKKYILSLSPEDQQYFAQFLQLQYGSSKMRPPISSAQYAEFHEKMGEWDNTYKLTNEFAAKMILDCMAHNFEKFTFEQVRYVQPKSNSNVVRCPRCGSTSVTTEEQGYGLFGWIGASQKKNLCQKCGHKWWPGR